MSGLIDTHAHLHDRAFDNDRDATLRRARDARIDAIVTVGTDIAESEAAVALARSQADVYAAVGLHAHDAKDWNAATRDRLCALAGDPNVVAIGEIGLDFYRNLSPPDAQRRAFREQLQLATALVLPVVIHSRDAHAETYAILREWAPTASCDGPLGVMHCFSGDEPLALRYVSLGFVVAFGGTVTYPRNEALRAAAVAVPETDIVVETDSPYLTPQARRGCRNEPAYVRETARFLAGLRDSEEDMFAATTSANARRLFRLAQPETIAP